MTGTEYWIHDTLEYISPWEGNISGESCTPNELLKPGKNCFGKILNFNCTTGTILEIHSSGGISASKTVEDCNSTDIF